MSLTGADLSMLAAFRRTQRARLEARGRWCRAKALEPGECPDKWLTRAIEAEECARIIADLNPDYVAPAKPDMKAAKASRGDGGRG